MTTQSQWRDEQLFHISDHQLTDAVWKGLDKLAPGVGDGLQGIDAATDGLTRKLWEQACYAAEMMEQEPNVTAELEKRARRVAMAILAINGYADGVYER